MRHRRGCQRPDRDLWGRPDNGSVLPLLPACLLIVFVLAAVAVDLSLVQLRQRQALDVAASAADDAATLGADRESLRNGGYVLDPAATSAAVQAAVAASDLAPHLDAPPQVQVTGATVEVTLTVRAEHLFTGAIPGAARSTAVTATATATAHEP